MIEDAERIKEPVISHKTDAGVAVNPKRRRRNPTPLRDSLTGNGAQIVHTSERIETPDDSKSDLIYADYEPDPALFNLVELDMKRDLSGLNDAATRPKHFSQLSPRGTGIGQNSSDSENSTLRTYLKEIGGIPLLTAEQEVELAKAIEAGKKAKFQLEDNIADDQIEADGLQKQVAEGESARKKMIESNLRLVVAVARKYMNRGLPLLDLIQEGNIGLMRGVEKFDYRKGFKFSTYAYWWIRQGVTRAIADQSRIIRIPVHIIDLMGKLEQLTGEFLNQNGREPTIDELAKAAGTTPGRISDLLNAKKNTISLDLQIKNDPDKSTIGDIIADPNSDEAQTQLQRDDLHDRLTAILQERLTPAEIYVLLKRKGVGEVSGLTLAQIGGEMNLSRERIRQIEQGALRKLRLPHNRAYIHQLLQDYLED